MSQLLLLFTPQTTHCITWWRTCLLWMPPLLLSQCMLFAQTHIQIWGFSWNSIKLSVFSNNTYNAHFPAITVGPLVTTLLVCGSFDVMFSFTPACRWYIVLTHEEVTWQDTKKSQDAAMILLLPSTQAWQISSLRLFPQKEYLRLPRGCPVTENCESEMRYKWNIRCPLTRSPHSKKSSRSLPGGIAMDG